MLTQKQIDFLNSEIKEGYGNPKQLAKHLDKAMEMLFYVEEDTFDRKVMQNTASALKLVSDALKIKDIV